MLIFINASEAQAWTKYGGDTSCKRILANDNDEAFTERAKGWTFGYISALNEIMRQRFKTPPENELIWQAIKEFCADNLDSSHYVASATIYIELLRDQGGHNKGVKNKILVQSRAAAYSTVTNDNIFCTSAVYR